MREEWRPVVGYEGLYEVSNRGRVKSVERTVWNGRGYKIVAERILKPQKARDYLGVVLCKDGKVKRYLVHRLVATVFCENPEGYTEVNHINEIKSDNRAENLEWCSRSYNNTYNGRAKKIAEKKSKSVIGIDKISGLIVEFSSIREAERQIGIDKSHICACCKGKLNSCGGFYWMYDDADAE